MYYRIKDDLEPLLLAKLKAIDFLGFMFEYSLI